jgi:hypothetical protein
MPYFSNPNGEKPSPDAETLDLFLAKMPAQTGFCSSPAVNKHQISSI